MNPAPTPEERRRVYARLLQSCALAPDDGARWDHLMAAHVVGQADWRLHLHSHWRMLRLAVAGGDVREAAGQCLRLALVPLGHALDRLPTGNVGRATVSAFQTMEPPARIVRLVEQAQAA